MSGCAYEVFRCLSDNIGVVLKTPGGQVVAIDAPEAEAVRRALHRRGWDLTDILITHPHPDHIGGVAALKAASGCRVTGPAGVGLSWLDCEVHEGTQLDFGGFRPVVWHTPGHCPQHVCYIDTCHSLAFVGDVLFSLGCGRLLDGTADQMFTSVRRLGSLPDQTLVFCGHDYTLANARFALSLQPSNAALQAYVEKKRVLADSGELTVPFLLGPEKEFNPFLAAQDGDTFARLRRLKDQF